MEWYRSGHNELHWNCSTFFLGAVGSNPTHSAKTKSHTSIDLYGSFYILINRKKNHVQEIRRNSRTITRMVSKQ